MRNYVHPFRQPGSLIYEVFRLCEAGTTEKKIVQLCKRRQGDPIRILKAIRRGSNRGQSRTYQWDLEEHNGYIKIYNIRPIPKLEG